MPFPMFYETAFNIWVRFISMAEQGLSQSDKTLHQKRLLSLPHKVSGPWSNYIPIQCPLEYRSTSTTLRIQLFKMLLKWTSSFVYISRCNTYHLFCRKLYPVHQKGGMLHTTASSRCSPIALTPNTCGNHVIKMAVSSCSNVDIENASCYGVNGTSQITSQLSVHMTRQLSSSAVVTCAQLWLDWVSRGTIVAWLVHSIRRCAFLIRMAPDIDAMLVMRSQGRVTSFYANIFATWTYSQSNWLHTSHRI